MSYVAALAFDLPNDGTYHLPLTIAAPSPEAARAFFAAIEAAAESVGKVTLAQPPVQARRVAEGALEADAPGSRHRATVVELRFTDLEDPLADRTTRRLEIAGWWLPWSPLFEPTELLLRAFESRLTRQASLEASSPKATGDA